MIQKFKFISKIVNFNLLAVICGYQLPGRGYIEDHFNQSINFYGATATMPMPCPIASASGAPNPNLIFELHFPRC